MSFVRRLAWSTSLHEIQVSGRVAAPALVAAGKFDRRAIMQLAVSIARRFGSSCQLDWKGRMRIGLRTAWQRAKEAMARTAAPVKAAQDRRASAGRPGGNQGARSRFSPCRTTVPVGASL